MSEQKEKVIWHYSTNAKMASRSFLQFTMLLEAAIKMAPSTLKFTCPEIETLESRIKELEDENKKLIEHVIKVHKTSIAYGKEGMDIFAHTKLRDEYNEIICSEAIGRKKDLKNV